jgi:hypothetical protein
MGPVVWIDWGAGFAYAARSSESLQPPETSGRRLDDVRDLAHATSDGPPEE